MSCILTCFKKYVKSLKKIYEDESGDIQVNRSKESGKVNYKDIEEMVRQQEIEENRRLRSAFQQGLPPPG